jgi:phosphoglycolate phosphatase
MIKLVAFDWNGTLLADAPAIVEGVNEELKIFNHPPITIKEYRATYEVPISNFFQKLGISAEEIREKSQVMAEVFHGYYEPRVMKSRTRAGTRKLLMTLNQQKIDSIILSNHTLEGIYLQLERLKLGDYFSTVLANETIEGAHFKGKKARLDQYIADHDIKPTETIIVGDTTEEIYIGQELGLHTVAIGHGYHSLDRLRLAAPEFLINRLVGLLEVVDNINGAGQRSAYGGK